MSDRNGPRGAPKPWGSGVVTAPLPDMKRAAPAEEPSPDSSGELADAPRKLADVRRSPEVERMLEGLSYPRPHAPVERATTDGDLSAAHHAGPRPLVAGVHTPVPEPALVLSQSLIAQIERPRPAIDPSAVVTPVPRSRRPKITTVLIGRRVARRATVAALAGFAVALVVAALVVRAVRPTHAAGAHLEPIVAPGAELTPTPPESAAALPVVEPSPTTAPSPVVASPAAVHAPPVASARPGTLVAAPPASPSPGARTRPALRPASPAAKPTASTNDVPSIHTDFEVQ